MSEKESQYGKAVVYLFERSPKSSDATQAAFVVRSTETAGLAIGRIKHMNALKAAKGAAIGGYASKASSFARKPSG